MLERAANRSQMTTALDSRTPLERVVAEGENPVGDVECGSVDIEREYRPTREIGWEAGGTTPQG